MNILKQNTTRTHCGQNYRTKDEDRFLQTTREILQQISLTNHYKHEDNRMLFTKVLTK